MISSGIYIYTNKYIWEYHNPLSIFRESLLTNIPV